MSFHSVPIETANSNEANVGSRTQGNPNDANTSLFTSREGHSMLFYIPLREPERHRYKQLIHQFGGVITDTEPSEATTRTGREIIYLSAQPDRGKAGILLQYIDQSINRGQLLVTDPFEFDLTGVQPLESKVKPTRGHSRFTPEKDAFILKKVRLNPKFRNSHRFFDDLATEDMLRGHTGNSIRSRYRKVLEKELHYVYKVDERGRVVRNEEGKKIRLGLDELPDTLKNKYTAHEDYVMCVAARDYLGRDGGKENIKLPYSFFSLMNRKEPKHTLHSWRDHYRKYVKENSIPEFIDYYERCLNQGVEPNPLSMSKEHSKAKGGLLQEANEFKESLGSRYKRPLYPSAEHYGESALDEEIGELKSSNIDEALIGNERTKRKAIPIPKLASLGEFQEDDSTSQEYLGPNGRGNQTNSKSLNAIYNEFAGAGSDEELDYSTANEQDRENEINRKVLEGLKGHELSDFQTANILNQHDFHEDTPRKRLKADDQSQYDSYRTAPATQVESQLDELNSQSIPRFEIRYADKPVTYNKLLQNSDEFLRNCKEILKKLYKVIDEADGSIYILYVGYLRLGLTDTFLGHAMMTTGGARIPMKKYTKYLVESIRMSFGLGALGETELDRILFTNLHIEGVWDQTQDEQLNSKEGEAAMIKFHGEERVSSRRYFLKDVESDTAVIKR